MCYTRFKLQHTQMQENCADISISVEEEVLRRIFNEIKASKSKNAPLQIKLLHSKLSKNTEMLVAKYIKNKSPH